MLELPRPGRQPVAKGQQRLSGRLQFVGGRAAFQFHPQGGQPPHGPFRGCRNQPLQPFLPRVPGRFRGRRGRVEILQRLAHRVHRHARRLEVRKRIRRKRLPAARSGNQRWPPITARRVGQDLAQTLQHRRPVAYLEAGRARFMPGSRQRLPCQRGADGTHPAHQYPPGRPVALTASAQVVRIHRRHVRQVQGRRALVRRPRLNPSPPVPAPHPTQRVANPSAVIHQQQVRLPSDDLDDQAGAGRRGHFRSVQVERQVQDALRRGLHDLRQPRPANPLARQQQQRAGRLRACARPLPGEPHPGPVRIHVQQQVVPRLPSVNLQRQRSGVRRRQALHAPAQRAVLDLGPDRRQRQGVKVHSRPRARAAGGTAPAPAR